ncbi:MAG: aldehyde dehydrogenase family protein [Actinomycetota bacterium]
MIAVWKLWPRRWRPGTRSCSSPREETPVTALMLGALAREAGFPPGVVNVVMGAGPAVAGHRLVVHLDVQKVSLTGETVTGRTVMREAAVEQTSST